MVSRGCHCSALARTRRTVSTTFCLTDQQVVSRFQPPAGLHNGTHHPGHGRRMCRTIFPYEGTKFPSSDGMPQASGLEPRCRKSHVVRVSFTTLYGVTG